MKIRVVTGVALGAALVIPSAASAAPTPDHLSGAAVYAATGNQLSRYSGSGEWHPLASFGAAQFAASPDGTKAAWITESGNLNIRARGRTSTIVSGLQGSTPCLTPVWSTDSDKVAYPSADGTIRAVRADGSNAPRRLGVSKGVCHLAWSGNGRYLAGYTSTGDALYRLDSKTGKTVIVRGVRSITHVQSLSPDGSKAIVALPENANAAGAGTWPATFRPVILAIPTGKRQQLPVKGNLIGATYLPDGRLVVRTAAPHTQSGNAGGHAHNTLVVFDSAGNEIQRLAEPPKAKNQALLQVVS
ncbi:TolB family protein [Nonomuraea sp. NPDC050153]|uniref:TolB family protein n=1 Tax=Nonomuraea sp. NPDC050153 TaxID=3364359 RepID=UPI0037AA3B52